jgi:hypothetical protein
MDGRRVAVERRRAVRRVPSPADPLSRARLRTGPELSVAEISNLGALVRTSARLLPGTHVDVHLVTIDGRVLRRARVARASVWVIEATGIAYQVALAFDISVDSSVRRVGATRVEEFASRPPGEQLPAAGDSQPADAARRAPSAEASGAVLAPNLEKWASCTFAKESADVDL